MKRIALLLISLITIIASTIGQSAGDYRSIGNGNWNDATKWQVYNGSNWTGTNAYPGQNPGTGTVTITNATQILITANVPNPISTLYVNTDFDRLLVPGKLVFSSANAVSLVIVGDLIVYGSLVVADQSGAKSHSLSIGGSIVAGTWIYVLDTTCFDLYSCPGTYDSFYPEIQTIYNDDKLNVIFNTTKTNSSISGPGGIIFQDVIFNGLGISIETPVYINGNANFINGIVKSGSFCNPGCIYDASGSGCAPSVCGIIFFNDGANVTGASINSFVDGRVWKQGDDPFTFPIGSEGVYSPLTISAPIGVGETFSARYVRAGQDPSLWGITDPALYSLSNCEYWELNPGGTYLDLNNYNNAHTSYGLNVTVGWSPSSTCGSSYVTNVANVALAHFNGASWDTHGGSATGTTASGTITRSGVNYFGPFTLGNMNANCVTVSGLNVTNITTNSGTLNWSAAPGAISYDVAYKTTYTNSWTNVAGITATSLNLTGLSPLVSYDWKVRENCGTSASAYRLGAQFTTQNPCSTPSGLTTTNITSNSATLSWGAVATAINYSVQYKPSTATTWIDAVIGTSSLSYNLTSLSASSAYDWRVVALCSYDPATYTYYGSNAAQSSFITTAFTVCNDVYENNNTSAQAKTISFGTTISGGISSSTDIDWFKLSLANAATVQVTLSNLPVDYDLYLYNKNFVLIGSSTNTGTSNEVVAYNSRTRNATLYIKVVGKNGAYSVSQCYSLLTQAAAGAGFVTRALSERGNEIAEPSHDQLLYPNPASNVIYLRFTSGMEGIVDVQIMNNAGQVMKQYAVHVVSGNNEVRIPVLDIIPGMYILKLSSGGSTIMRKFLIAR